MIVWIVGSGHIGELPKGYPDKIYYANGGVFNKRNIPSRDVASRVITTAHVLAKPSRTKSKESEKVLDLLFENGPYEFLWVRDTLSVEARDVVANSLAIKLSVKRATLNYDLIYDLLLYALGRRLFFKSVFLYFFQRPMYFSTRLLVGLARGTSIRRLICNMRKMKVSTGVLALLVALYESNLDDTFYLLGVSAGESPYSYNGELAKRDNHIEADLIVLRRMVTDRLFKVIIQDRDLAGIINS